MTTQAPDPRIPTKPSSDFPEIACLMERVVERLSPIDVYLYGSRARGDAGPDSDWDIKVVVADDAPDDLLSPEIGWDIQEDSGVYADISCIRISDFIADLDIPNTGARQVLSEGVRIDAR